MTGEENAPEMKGFTQVALEQELGLLLVLLLLINED